MEEKFTLKNCRKDDVLSFDSTMFKVDKLSQEVENILGEYKLGEELSKKFGSQNISINVGGESRYKSYHYFY